MNECQQLINRRIEAFTLGVLWVAGLFLFYYIFSAIWYRYAMIYPILNKIEQIEKRWSEKRWPEQIVNNRGVETKHK